jgi:hypothetical protein
MWFPVLGAGEEISLAFRQKFSFSLDVSRGLHFRFFRLLVPG